MSENQKLKFICPRCSVEWSWTGKSISTSGFPEVESAENRPSLSSNQSLSNGDIHSNIWAAPDGKESGKVLPEEPPLDVFVARMRQKIIFYYLPNYYLINLEWNQVRVCRDTTSVDTVPTKITSLCDLLKYVWRPCVGSLGKSRHLEQRPLWHSLHGYRQVWYIHPLHDHYRSDCIAFRLNRTVIEGFYLCLKLPAVRLGCAIEEYEGCLWFIVDEKCNPNGHRNFKPASCAEME